MSCRADLFPRILANICICRYLDSCGAVLSEDKSVPCCCTHPVGTCPPLCAQLFLTPESSGIHKPEAAPAVRCASAAMHSS